MKEIGRPIPEKPSEPISVKWIFLFGILVVIGIVYFFTYIEIYSWIVFYIISGIIVYFLQSINDIKSEISYAQRELRSLERKLDDILEKIEDLKEPEYERM